MSFEDNGFCNYMANLLAQCIACYLVALITSDKHDIQPVERLEFQMVTTPGGGNIFATLVFCAWRGQLVDRILFDM